MQNVRTNLDNSGYAGERGEFVGSTLTLCRCSVLNNVDWTKNFHLQYRKYRQQNYKY